ncbi:MAG: ATP-binding cassette domain-containing protein [Desulfatitalea sp.]|nr:ATP-binding cassette domain-containing protein [Desulfatitalea sp.]
MFGFLGPNGAGKTTTINMLTGLARPDAGKIKIGGIDCIKTLRGAQHMLGVLPDEIAFCMFLFWLSLQNVRKRCIV